MLNFQGHSEFSMHRSQRRLQKAERILGKRVVQRILAFALYLLGADFRRIAQILEIPQNTIKSRVRRIWNEGLVSLEDRRRKSSAFLPGAKTVEVPPRPSPKISIEKEFMNVSWSEHQIVKMPKKNTIQCRTVLLTLLAAKIIPGDEVAQALGISTERTRKLKTALIKQDAAALFDQRRGQQHDYRVTPDLKAELIQQFFLNISTGVSTSSQRLSDDLKERCQTDLDPRIIRIHLVKLGLPEIRETLPKLLRGIKKT